MIHAVFNRSRRLFGQLRGVRFQNRRHRPTPLTTWIRRARLLRQQQSGLPVHVQSQKYLTPFFAAIMPFCLSQILWILVAVIPTPPLPNILLIPCSSIRTSTPAFLVGYLHCSHGTSYEIRLFWSFWMDDMEYSVGTVGVFSSPFR